MRVRLLGPIEVEVDGVRRPVAGRRRRALIAALSLHRGAVVPTDFLIDTVWGDAPPATVNNSLQSHLSYLRRLTGNPAVVTFRSPGYVLTGVEESDLEVAERLLHQADLADDLPTRARLLTDVIGLWRGPALVDVHGSVWLEEQADRVEHLRFQVTRRLMETRIGLGDGVALVPELRDLVRQNPHDEELTAQLTVALYRSGRQAEALAATRDLRHRLNDDLGVDPGPAVRALEVRILRHDPQLAPTPDTDPDLDSAGASPPLETRRPLPAELPAPTAVFTGRRDGLALLDGLLERRDRGGRAHLVIALVSGSPGIGKSELAIEWSHRVRERFPDGQLFVDLRGYSGVAPLRSIDALTSFLLSLGLHPKLIPVGLDQAAALFRSMVAGRRILIVADNARSAEQVRPLLPGGAGSMVVVTSRSRLTGLIINEGAEPVTLRPFAPDEAGELLSQLLEPARLSAEAGQARELAEACAFLPLALRIAAAALASQPDRSIGDYLAQLKRNRLDNLTIDGDPDSGIRAAFDSSYQALSDRGRRVFRLLSLFPGADTTIEAAAALCGLDLAGATDTLAELGRAHLLDHSSHDRYGWHDLLRAYATERCRQEDPPPVRRVALSALHAYYFDRVRAAATLLYPHMLRIPAAAAADDPRSGAEPAAAINPFYGEVAALDWLNTERANLVAVVRHCADPEAVSPPPEPDLARAAGLIADGLRGYYQLHRHVGDWLSVAEAALAAAVALDDPTYEAAAHLSLGTAHRCLADLATARSHYDRAIVLARRAGWLDAEATALANVGIVDHGQGRLSDATQQLTLALAVDHRTGRPAGLANNTNNLAFVLLDQGKLSAAVALFQDGLTLNRRLGSRHGQALALTGLGQAHRLQGRFQTAARALGEAMHHSAAVGDRDGVATVHLALGAVHRDRAQTLDSEHHARTALGLGLETGDPRTQADAWSLLASSIADPVEAGDHYARAYELANTTALPRCRIEALIGLAVTAGQLGEAGLAIERARDAAEQAGQAGYLLLQGQALTALVTLILDTGDVRAAIHWGLEADRIHRTTGHTRGELQNAEALTRAFQHDGHASRSARYARRAADLTGQLG